MTKFFTKNGEDIVFISRRKTGTLSDFDNMNYYV